MSRLPAAASVTLVCWRCDRVYTTDRLDVLCPACEAARPKMPHEQPSVFEEADRVCFATPTGRVLCGTVAGHPCDDGRVPVQVRGALHFVPKPALRPDTRRR